MDINVSNGTMELLKAHTTAAERRPDATAAVQGSSSIPDNRPGSVVLQQLQSSVDRSPAVQRQAEIQAALDRPRAGGAGGRAVAQRLINFVYLADDETVRITRDNSRPQGNLRGHTGDHMTPYVTFDHQIIAAVEGQDLPTAWNSLKKTYETIQTMPGYLDSPYKDQFDDLAAELDGINGKKAGVDEILKYGNRIIEVRNMLRHTAYPVKGNSTGGQNESVASGLLEEERRIRKGNAPKYKAADVLKTMWDLFDHKRLAMSVNDDQERNKVLSQHRISMLDTYWRVAEAYGISNSSLAEYYKKNY